ncbi:hypothetical protein CYMTET_34955 [Cymbomonas tetramitiformis]|uniref:Sulfotransferase n=1 Tax=Cymbomonas tetramitiformis TaxID=36881 RepID=A0AAE0KPF9_9CHLO|nr:hypothetical protein CYMTET_34955 [Cymbomonas tetramitiformis]
MALVRGIPFRWIAIAAGWAICLFSSALAKCHNGPFITELQAVQETAKRVAQNPSLAKGVLPKAKPCVLFVFRHLLKTGGTTVLRTLQRNREFRRLKSGAWNPECFSEWSKKYLWDDEWARRNPYLWVEFHIAREKDVFLDFMNQLETYRHVAKRRGCEVVVATFLREPGLNLLSDFYHFQKCCQASNFTKFMLENEELQISQLLACSDVPTCRGHYPKAHVFRGPHVRTTRRVRWTLLQSVNRLLGDMDLVGITDHWKESMLLLADALGLQHFSLGFKAQPADRENYPTGTNSSTLMGGEHRAQVQRYREVHAPLSMQLYEQWRERLDQRVVESGNEFRQRMDSITQQLLAMGRVWT